MRIRRYLSVALFVLISAQAHAASYYVDPANGNDANNGASPSTAYKTLQKAADSTHPGDTVYAMAGTYTDTVDSSVLNVTTSGTASAPITYTSYKGQTPHIQLNKNNWEGILIPAGTQYIVIDGFEITGINPSLTWAGANRARVSGLANPMYNGTGVNLTGAYNRDTGAVTAVAHITVRNCVIHDCAEEGIGTGLSDYLTIKNNTIWNCAWYSSYDGSGISTWEDYGVDSNSSTYKMIVEGNKVYNCRNEIGCPQGLPYSITDGNGIIVDGDGSATTGIPYTGKILIADNLVYGCGGRGININGAHNVDVVNNTLYHNAQENSQANTLIEAGGAGAAPFAADSGFAGGSTDTPWTGDVDTSLVTNATPAPQAVYQSERFGSASAGFTYTIEEAPLKSYRIILLFTEDHWNAANERQFNVSIDGNPWLTNFDIYTAAGAMHKAVAEERQDTSDPDGNITIAFTPGKYGVPKVDGIEILSDYYTPNAEISFGAGHPVSGNFHCYNNIICPTAGIAGVGEWNVDPAKVVSDYNLYYDGSGSHPATSYADNHALWSDPLFIAPGGSGTANFHLRANSPAIGSGTSTLAPPVDRDGVKRPQGSRYDRGCYELAP